MPRSTRTAYSYSSSSSHTSHAPTIVYFQRSPTTLSRRVSTTRPHDPDTEILTAPDQNDWPPYQTMYLGSGPRPPIGPDPPGESPYYRRLRRRRRERELELEPDSADTASVWSEDSMTAHQGSAEPTYPHAHDVDRHVPRNTSTRQMLVLPSFEYNDEFDGYPPEQESLHGQHRLRDSSPSSSHYMRPGNSPARRRRTRSASSYASSRETRRSNLRRSYCTSPPSPPTLSSRSTHHSTHSTDSDAILSALVAGLSDLELQTNLSHRPRESSAPRAPPRSYFTGTSRGRGRARGSTRYAEPDRSDDEDDDTSTLVGGAETVIGEGPYMSGALGEARRRGGRGTGFGWEWRA